MSAVSACGNNGVHTGGHVGADHDLSHEPAARVRGPAGQDPAGRGEADCLAGPTNRSPRPKLRRLARRLWTNRAAGGGSGVGTGVATTTSASATTAGAVTSFVPPSARNVYVARAASSGMVTVASNEPSSPTVTPPTLVSRMKKPTTSPDIHPAPRDGDRLPGRAGFDCQRCSLIGYRALCGNDADRRKGYASLIALYIHKPRADRRKLGVQVPADCIGGNFKYTLIVCHAIPNRACQRRICGDNQECADFLACLESGAPDQ